MKNHLDIVRREHARQPPDTRTAEGILAFVVRVLKALPPAERAGLHAKPGGENIAMYKPAKLMVGISRVMYPNGDLVKILTDAGPGGVNGPAWNQDEPIEIERYVPVLSAEPDEPEDEDDEDEPEAPTPRVTYDELVNGDQALAKQLGAALKVYRGGWQPTDFAHFFWKLVVEGVPIEDVLKEIRG